MNWRMLKETEITEENYEEELKKTNNNNKIYYILSSCKYLWKQNKKIETNKEKYSIKKYKKENQCNF